MAARPRHKTGRRLDSEELKKQTTKPKKNHKKIIDSLNHIPSLEATIARMSSDGKITKEREEHIRAGLGEWVADSKYILFNLGVHMGIGFVRFTALPFPVPIGTILRPIWVIGNRLYCDFRWDMHRKKIHSLHVLLFSAIPFLGYFAYTIPLRKKSEYLTYLYAQHISYEIYDMTLEEKLAKAPRFIRRTAYALLVPSDTRPAG